MTVDYCYQYIQFLCRKNQTSSISPNEFQYAINKGQRDYFDFLLGKVEDFRYDDATPTTGSGANIKVPIDLAPFKKSNVNVAVTNGSSNGVALYPADYQYLTLMTDLSNRKIERIDDSKLPSRLGSVIDVFTDNTKSFYVEGSGQWFIYPNTLTNVLINYYRLPVGVIWNFSTWVLSAITGGTLYTNGTYNNVNLTGGSGTGATANITVSGGSVTSVTIVLQGTGYIATDILSAAAASIGGTGSGFSVTITSIKNRGTYNALGSVQPEWDDLSMEEILSRTARVLGFSFEKQGMVQLGEMTINRGE